MTDNMRIWEAVEKTDPTHTKKVNQRGGFTAIGANYQIKSATQQFGPIGIGWGYEASAPVFHDKFVIVPVTMWHGDRANVFGPVYGCCEMLGNRPDADAPKKAGTDGLTKLLSQLGFNADVFLGMFDDNKYIAELEREKRDKDKPKFDPAAARDRVKKKIEGAPTLEVLGEVMTTEKTVMREIEAAEQPMFSELVAAASTRKAELANQMNNQGAG